MAFIQGDLGDDLLEPSILLAELLPGAATELGQGPCPAPPSARLGDLLAGVARLPCRGSSVSERTALQVTPQLQNGPVP